MQLSRKQKAFSQFFAAVLKSNLNFEHFQKKKMSLIADVFPKLRTPKNMVISMFKMSRFKGSFGKQHGKRPKIGEISMAAPLPYLLITVNAIVLQKVSVSDMQNLTTVY